MGETRVIGCRRETRPALRLVSMPSQGRVCYPAAEAKRGVTMAYVHFRAWKRAIFLFGAVLGLMGGAWGSDDRMADEIAAASVFDEEIYPFLTQYCMRCHNEDRARADLNVMRFDSEAMAATEAALWSRIAARVESGEMPPEGSDAPAAEVRAAFVAWAQSLQEPEADCNRIASEASVNWYPGFVMSRRLNRMEYQNTLRDLLGIDLDVAHLFPADGAGGEGFNTTGSALFLSSIQMEKYLSAADLAMEAALPSLGALLGQPSARTMRDQAPRQKLLTLLPGPEISPREAAAVTLQEFLSRAWRRPPDKEELGRLLLLFDEAHAREGNFIAAIKLPLKAALVSPNFIFLAEPKPDIIGDYPLGDFEMAARLSYFLWATMPDEELTGLARAGRLQDEETLRRQVARMLRDPRSRALGEQFAAQWLAIEELGVTKLPDTALFPEFDDALAEVMREEVVTFFHRLVAEDRPLLDLVDGDYTFVNERLADHYGIEGVTGPEMREVRFADDTRGGVLGMAAVLTTTSHAVRTSPVLRGKWVLEQLLGDRVPPPPPDVGLLPEEEVRLGDVSLREALEAHRQNPDCAACHSRMDPIGFGLENFDAIGRFRREVAGLPIDASGTLPSGETFDGAGGLKQILLARRGDIMRNFSRKMLGYALGRGLTQFDDCVVTDGLIALESNGYRPSALITEIVLSYPFRYRYSGED